ncbi:hypothetical protein [Methylobacterium durans]|uniref:hypothetical protein n=1 Tax=Methylobacterium durans TaxID=2202825 RepID=UPI0013A53D55|nr:hypothetical protein [Methylobacterium durans]
MTSKHSDKVNVRGTQASVIPRSLAGQLRAEQNARTRWLATVMGEEATQSEIENLARQLTAQSAGDPATVKAARKLADAQVHLDRISTLRLSLMREVSSEANENSGKAFKSKIKYSEVLLNLDRLERHRRKAFSRRSTAMRIYESIKD